MGGGPFKRHTFLCYKEHSMRYNIKLYQIKGVEGTLSVWLSLKSTVITISSNLMFKNEFYVGIYIKKVGILG